MSKSRKQVDQKRLHDRAKIFKDRQARGEKLNFQERNILKVHSAKKKK